jgi:hypothetical protein
VKKVLDANRLTKKGFRCGGGGQINGVRRGGGNLKAYSQQADTVALWQVLPMVDV